MGSDFNDDMLKTIRLDKVLSRVYNTGVEVSTGNIVLVVFEHFIGTAEGSSKLGGQENFPGPRMSKRTRSPDW